MTTTTPTPPPGDQGPPESETYGCEDGAAGADGHARTDAGPEWPWAAALTVRPDSRRHEPGADEVEPGAQREVERGAEHDVEPPAYAAGAAGVAGADGGPGAAGARASEAVVEESAVFRMMGWGSGSGVRDAAHVGGTHRNDTVDEPEERSENRPPRPAAYDRRPLGAGAGASEAATGERVASGESEALGQSVSDESETIGQSASGESETPGQPETPGEWDAAGEWEASTWPSAHSGFVPGPHGPAFARPLVQSGSRSGGAASGARPEEPEDEPASGEAVGRSGRMTSGAERDAFVPSPAHSGFASLAAAPDGRPQATEADGGEGSYLPTGASGAGPSEAGDPAAQEPDAVALEAEAEASEAEVPPSEPAENEASPAGPAGTPSSGVETYGGLSYVGVPRAGVSPARLSHAVSPGAPASGAGTSEAGSSAARSSAARSSDTGFSDAAAAGGDASGEHGVSGAARRGDELAGALSRVEYSSLADVSVSGAASPSGDRDTLAPGLPRRGPDTTGETAPEIPAHLLFRDEIEADAVTTAAGSGAVPPRTGRVPVPARGPAPVRPAPYIDPKLTERPGPSLPGRAAVFVGICALVACAAVLWWAGAVPGAVEEMLRLPSYPYHGVAFGQWALLAIGVTVVLFTFGGLGRGRVGHGWVLTLCGDYRGTVRRTGLLWVSPLLLRHRVDVRLRHWRSEPLPAVDANGTALRVVILVVWRVRDTVRAVLGVRDHEEYLREQVEAAVARVLSQLPADAFHENEPTLRDAVAVGDALTRRLAAECRPIGLDVFSAQPTRIEYAPEIADAMQRSRVAALDVRHRDGVLTAVVDAVDETVRRLTHRGLVELDDDERKTLVKDLTVAFYAARHGGGEQR
ncbi:SPFH domain-containing protein [Streptomyces sp. NPDC088725]|uniref:SPFH domain-containing protein n=1 Tax=Streptomyces sp. NPDC088725 TaxID=3365873 RepID=UPI00381F1414